LYILILTNNIIQLKNGTLRVDVIFSIVERYFNGFFHTLYLIVFINNSLNFKL
jgi:hypothetical protein